MQKIKRIGIVVKHHRELVLKFVREVIRYLEGKVDICIEKKLAEKLGAKVCKGKKTFELGKANLDLLLAMGGDGTILKIEHENSAQKIPVLGVNMGMIGFLAEVEGDFRPYLDRVLKGDFFVEERIKLQVKLNGKHVGDVLNDVVITSATPVKILKFSVQVHGEKLEKIVADGIVVATPTGSTAYAMSAGGPIIDPTLNAYEIVALSPFRLSSRPITVPADTKTKIHITTNRPGILVLDGYLRIDITRDDLIEVTKSQNKAYFIKFEDNFYKKIRKKLV